MGCYPELKGKSAIVTGGTAGIGKQTALMLADEGANVAVIARDNERGQAVENALRAKGTNSFFVSCEVINPDACKAAYSEIVRRLGKIDILVNCAGGFGRPGKVSDFTVAEFDDILNSNLRSTFLFTQLVLPEMTKQQWGRIVNVSSLVALGTHSTTSALYAAAKAGILGFTRHTAMEVAKYGVTINATLPGFTRSERILRIRTPEEIVKSSAAIPVGRICEPEEQAAAILFLCSQKAAFITGASMNVSGGVVF